MPIAVKEVFDKVKGADAILMGIAENNHLLTAAGKNAYDWLSRGGENSAVFKKPMGQVGVGVVGGTSAAAHLKQVVNYCNGGLNG